MMWERLGVPVTAGIARSRTLAKLISDSAKAFKPVEALGPVQPAPKLTGFCDEVNNGGVRGTDTAFRAE
jgi:hypothetical protein